MPYKDTHPGLYEYEIDRFLELYQSNREYAFQRYGFTLLYSLPPEETLKVKNDLGWKSREALDYYNLGTIECMESRFKEALKHFEKAESMGCDQPELFYNLAVLYDEQDDFKAAKAYFEKYIEAVERWDDIPKKLQKELDEVREHIKTLEASL